MLGEEYAGTLRTWRDTYDEFLKVYTADDRRSKRMDRMNELFRAMFIDRHPAYGLYRHWYDVLERSPEFPAPPTSDPTPRLSSEPLPLTREDLRDSKYVDPNPTTQRNGFRTFAIIAVPTVVLLAILSFALLTALNGSPSQDIVLTISATPQDSAVQATDVPTENNNVAVAADVTEEASETPRPTTPAPTNTPRPTTPAPSATTRPATDTPAPSDTPTEVPPPTATFTAAPPTETPLPPEGITGSVDLFALAVANPTEFDAEVFTPVDGGYRIGRGVAGVEEMLIVAMPNAVMEIAYGNGAASRVRRLDVELTLRTFNPAIVDAEDVYFGALLLSTTNDDEVGLRIEVASQNVINIYQVLNGEKTFLSQKSVNAVIARIRLERDLATGSVSLYYNDELLGTPVGFLAGDAPVEPAIFVKDGGVVIGATNWKVTLR
jgi:hypothetical protein